MDTSKMIQALEDKGLEKLLSKSSSRRKWLNLVTEVSKELLTKPQNIKSGKNFVIIRLEQKRFYKYLIYVYDGAPNSYLIMYSHEPNLRLDQTYDEITEMNVNPLGAILTVKTKDEEFIVRKVYDRIEEPFNIKVIEANPIEPLILAIMENLQGHGNEERYNYVKQYSIKYESHLF